VKLAITGAFGALLFAAPAPYALSRFRFRRRNPVTIGLLAFQMISPLVIMVPLYRYMRPGRAHRQVSSALRSSTSPSPRRSSPEC
jgi:ABC-type glycerol-3-phosphate transport system permease component